MPGAIHKDELASAWIDIGSKQYTLAATEKTKKIAEEHANRIKNLSRNQKVRIKPIFVKGEWVYGIYTRE